jgi:hypothetical protein
MAITLLSNYQKRLGLPGYSSHSFQVSLESEITDLGQVQGEVARLYSLLQDAVDREIQQVGFVPGDDYGNNHNGNGSSNDHSHNRTAGANNGQPDRWSCSDKQRELILKLVGENNLDRDTVEDTAVDRFGVGVKSLNKLQASGLISELIDSCAGTQGNGGKRPHNGKGGNGR